MRYRALATDYDGTIARDGRVDEPTLAALRRARAAGLRLLLVTGRVLSDLFDTFPQVALFDRVVAENGALLYEPSTRAVRTLASPPPPAFLEALERAAVPISVGQSIVATAAPHEHEVLQAIRDLGIGWHVILNKGSVMALPAGVTKATGLAAALASLAVDPSDTVGVGDAENDQALLASCGLGVAVANALPALQEAADIVTAGEGGDGVVELIARLLAGELDDAPAGRSGPAERAHP
jgi:hydroxymethylpyrimidine pyrophosphatase-like HAD family hydrolase